MEEILKIIDDGVTPLPMHLPPRPRKAPGKTQNEAKVKKDEEAKRESEMRIKDEEKRKKRKEELKAELAKLTEEKKK